jgi:hypothetical protein
MLFWWFCVLCLFVLAEMFNWLRGFTIPFPLYILAGVFLAIASNYGKMVGTAGSNLIQGIFPQASPVDSLRQSTPTTYLVDQPVEDTQK